jgi:hypothetical protein
LIIVGISIEGSNKHEMPTLAVCRDLATVLDMSRVNLSRSFLQTRAGTFSWIFPPELKLIPVEPSRAESWQRYGDLMDWPLDYVWMALRDTDSDNALKAMVHAPQNISLRITKQGRGNKACLLLPLRYRLVLIASSGTGRPSQCRLVS